MQPQTSLRLDVEDHDTFRILSPKLQPLTPKGGKYIRNQNHESKGHSGRLPGAHPKSLKGGAANLTKYIKKFGPVVLIITLLFAVKYLLIAIHLNVHSLKFDIKEQCESTLAGRLNSSLVDEGLSMETVKNENWQLYRMVGRGMYSYVQFSAYRTSSNEIVAVGFGARVLREHRQVLSCIWHGADGHTFLGEPTVLYPENPSDDQYEAVVIKCELKGSITSASGGYLVSNIDNEHMVLYREEGNSEAHKTLGSPHKYETTFCTWPISVKVNGQRLEEWVEIHKAVGANHMVAYDAGGMDREAAKHLKKYLDEEFLEMTPMREIAHFKIHGEGSVVAANDCLFRSSLHSKWVVYLDWDDILHLETPSFLSILLQENDDKPWLSHGAQWWGLDHCVPSPAGRDKSEKKFPQERMLFHWPHYFCVDGEPVDNKFCPGGRGHRYVIANPHRVKLLNKNEVLDPKEGGVELSALDVRHEHFDNIHKIEGPEKMCNNIHDFNDKIDWWAKGTEVREQIVEVRKKMYPTPF